MTDEDTVLKEPIKHLGEASRRIRASRNLMQENALVDAPNYLRLVARLNTKLKEARRQLGVYFHPWFEPFYARSDGSVG